MREALAALQAFWSGFGMAAYLAGQVPPGAALPYVTYEARLGGFGQAARCLGTGWFTGEGANRARADFLAAVEARVPEGGLRLPLPGGMLVLERGGEGFLTLAEEESTPRVCGGRALLTARRY